MGIPMYSGSWDTSRATGPTQLDLFEVTAGPVPMAAGPSPLDRQVGGDHYMTATIQPIQYIQANNLNFCEGSAIKYITRHRRKGGKQDLEKAIHYLQMEIANSYTKEPR